MMNEERSRIARVPLSNQAQMSLFPSEYGESTLESDWTVRDSGESRISSRWGEEGSLHEKAELVHRKLEEIESIYHSAPVGLCVLDRSLRYVRINDLLAKMNGVPADRHIGKTVREIIPDLADPIEEIAGRILRTGEPVLDFELTGMTRNKPGVNRHWNESWLPIKDISGNVIGINVVIVEITEKKNAELTEKQALRESEERLRLALRGACQGIWDWDLKTRVMIWDGRCKEIFGFEGDAPVTYEWHIQHLHPDDRQRVARGVVRALSEKVEFEKEYRTLLPDGTIRWVLSCGRVFYDEAGVPYRMSGTVLDITERKRVEEELRENEERLNLAIHSAGMGTLEILLKTGKGVWSENNFHLLGYDRGPDGTATMEMWLSRVHPGDLDRFLREMEQARREHTLFAPEYRIIRAGTGEVIWISLFGRYLYDANGEPVRFVGVFFNSTERKTMEEELRIARDKLELHVMERTSQLKKANLELQTYTSRLERMNRDLQDFAFVASHDLQEPLRTIQTYCTRIEAVHGETLCGDVRESLRRVAKSAARMRDLIASMYLYHRATQKSLVVEETDLKTLIEEVLLEFQESILESRGMVVLENLPVISAEAPQMRRLFQSLIANSLKYRRKEAPPVIRICGETEGDACRISVTDNGIGFDEKYLSRIFRPFQRLHGRGEYEGAGMGLTICRKVVENHQGAITAKSVPGGGTTFLITLPLRQTA